MYLLFKLNHQGIRFGLVTTTGETIIEAHAPVRHWSKRTMQQVFESDVLSKLRSQGKIVTKIGIVIPVGPKGLDRPQLAGNGVPQIYKKDALLLHLMSRYEYLFYFSKKAWPHIPHFWLSDTCLSDSFPRAIGLPPFSYDACKQFDIRPVVLESYAHKSNMTFANSSRPFVSLVVEDITSLALIDGGQIVDVYPAYSYWSSLMGLYYGAPIDSGTISRLVQSVRLDSWVDFITDTTGLIPMTSTDYNFDVLLNLSGLVGRGSSVRLPEVSIETMEYIELSIRFFIKSLRSGVAGLLAEMLEVRQIVVSSSQIVEESGFWHLLNHGALSHVAVVYNPRSSLELAGLELNQ